MPTRALTGTPGERWLEHPFGALLDVVASRSAPVGGGGTAVVVAALAAALVERCATEAGDERAREQAAAARTGLCDLVEVDAAALIALMRTSADGADGELAATLAHAASAPMERLREIAGGIARRAIALEHDGKAALRGEAQCARILAAAAADAAEAVIAANGSVRRADATPPGAAAVVDLAGEGQSSGPLWGMQSEELNATLLAWPPGHVIAAHRNDERDVLLVVLAGSARVTLDEVEHALAADQLLLLPRGSVRAVTAGPRGVRYLSTHRRRGPLLPTARTAS